MNLFLRDKQLIQYEYATRQSKLPKNKYAFKIKKKNLSHEQESNH